MNLLIVAVCGTVREWFHDAVNFNGKQSRDWDTLPSHRLRKLFSRVDSRAYVQLLEETLRSKGTDPTQLASSLGLRPHDLKV